MYLSTFYQAHFMPVLLYLYLLFVCKCASLIMYNETSAIWILFNIYNEYRIGLLFCKYFPLHCIVRARNISNFALEIF